MKQFFGIFFFQNCGIGSKLLSYAESLGSIQQLIIPSARTDLIRYYDKKGYKEISRFNFADTEDTTTAEFIKHTGVEMITMQKKTQWNILNLIITE